MNAPTRLFSLPLLAAALVVASAAGCASYDAAGITTCVDDNDCALRDVCMLGVCTNPVLLDIVDLEVRPQEESGLLPQQFFDARPGEDGRSAFTLARTISRPGTVETPDGAPAVARVVAIPELSITGRTLVTSSTSTSSGQYELGMVEGQAYRVSIYPERADLAPQFWPNLQLATSLDEGSPLDVVLDDPATLVHVSGRVVAGDGASALPIPDLEVRVLDGEVLVSSTAFTDAAGRFDVAVADSRGQNVRIEIRPGDLNPFFPVVRLAPADYLESTDLGDVPLGQVLSPVPVSGQVLGPDNVPVPGAAIYVRGQIGEGVIRRVMVAREDGSFDSELPPGTYDVAAVAPTSTGSAGMAQESAVTIAAGGASLSLVLGPRVPVVGTVFDALGDTVSGAAIQLTRLGPPGGVVDTVLEAASWSFAGLSDGDGTFSLPADAGRYRVDVKPPAGTGLPLHSEVVDVFADPPWLELHLPVAGNFAGQLLGPDDAPLGGARVRVFSKLVGETGQAIVLGDGNTDADGNFGIVVPDLTRTGTASSRRSDSGEE